MSDDAKFVAIAKLFTGMSTTNDRSKWAKRNLKNAGRSKYGERFYRFKDGDSKIKVRVAHGGDVRGEAHSEVHWDHKPTLGARVKRAVGLKTKKPNFARAAAGSIAAMERDRKRTGTSAYRVYGLNRTYSGTARRGRDTAHAKIYRRMAASHKVEGMQTDLSHPSHITFRVRKSLEALATAIEKAGALVEVGVMDDFEKAADPVHVLYTEIEKARGLLPGNSLHTRRALLRRSIKNNASALAGEDGAQDLSRRLGVAQHYLTRRLVRSGHRFK